MRYFVIFSVILFFNSEIFAQYEGNAGSGSAQQIYNGSNCSQFLGDSGSGYNSSFFSYSIDCISYFGGDNSGHSTEIYNNPYSCIQFTSSALGNSGYDSRSLSDDAGACVIVVLPIDSSPLFGEVQGRQGFLFWETYSEYNNQGFEILKSIDGVNWEVIGWVNGFLNSTEKHEYEFIDPLLNSGNNYYRFRQIDTDGESVFSNIVNLSLSQKENILNHFVIYPNPIASNEYLQIRSWTNMDTEVKLKIMDGIGRILFDSDIIFYNGQQIYQLQVPFSPGPYYLILEQKLDGTSNSLPFIIR